MLSLKSRSSSRSPIREVPYDVLREIFRHCLPQHPLEIQQPNTTVAPMLLCQICSSWRTIALASPSSWSHLSLCVDVRKWAAFPEKEISFILWWKGNQGSMAPFLRLEVIMDISLYHMLEGAKDELAVLIKYVSSAQYLQVDPTFGWTEDDAEIGDKVEFPNLHTLAIYWPEGWDNDTGYFCRTPKVLLRLALARTPSLLRRLAVNNHGVPTETIIPSQWSALTHLSMGHLFVPLDFWFSLVRTVTDLQWAYILFDGIYDTEQYPEPSTKFTLPQLSTLFITYDFRRGDCIELPLSLLFSALYLPTLHTLSLSSTADSWGDHRAIHEIYTVLRSTPATTALALRGRGFLTLDDEDDFPPILSKIDDVEPIWNNSPHLTHLRLELPDDYITDFEGEVLDTFVGNFLSSRSWLALESAICPIKSVTFIAADPFRSPCSEDVRDLTMSSIRKHAGGMWNTVFDVISNLEDDNGEEAWKEWGSRNN